LNFSNDREKRKAAKGEEGGGVNNSIKKKY